LLVHCDTYGLQAQGECGLGCASECVLFHNDVVAALAEQAQSGVPSIGAAGCQGALPIGINRLVNELIELVLAKTLNIALNLLRCAR
jgi:hypothetical protein